MTLQNFLKICQEANFHLVVDGNDLGTPSRSVVTKKYGNCKVNNIQLDRELPILNINCSSEKNGSKLCE